MRFSGVFTRHRFALQASFDAAAWIVAVLVAAFLRYEFEWDRMQVSRLLAIGALASVLMVVIGRHRGLYIHRWRYGTLEEGMNCAIAVALVTPVVALVNRFPLGHYVPVSVTLMAPMAALVVMGAGRFVFRSLLERSQMPGADSAEPIIVFGAGEATSKVVRAMLGTPTSPYVPVALLDDNPALSNLRIKSVPVMGTRHDIARLARSLDVKTMLFAVPSAAREDVQDIVARADAAGLRTLILPSMSERYGAPPRVGDIRPLTESDLLGRRELQTDVDAVAGYLTGKRVLVTGAGGSIGSELCRHIHRFAPAELVMLDRDESALQAVQVSIEGRGLLDDDRLVVADIRDEARISEVFARFQPQVVFHAAALKHLPLLELHPTEGVKTNVWGTQVMLRTSQRFGVDTFVNISTDKAADPTSVLGATKRVAEQLTAHAAADSAGTYLSVRFGNVIGSRGSVLPLFRKQIEAGGPVTITHPDVTRFFMTIPEACELVIQAGAIGRSGEVMVLDMGEPVRIADLAQRLIAESGKDIEIQYTGLRPGEKLHEQLFGADEASRRQAHPLIGAVRVPPVSPRDAEARLDELGVASVDLRVDVPRRRATDVPLASD